MRLDGVRCLRIPRPIGASPDDRFATFVVEGDSYRPGYSCGAVLVIKLGTYIPGVPHAIDAGEGVVIARLTPESKQRCLVESFCRGFKDRIYSMHELQIIGASQEFYPQGVEAGNCWVQRAAVVRLQTQYERPLLTASAR